MLRRIWLMAVLLFACRLSPPDAASEAAAILHTHPAEFVDRLQAMDALVLRQFPQTGDPSVLLLDSLARYREHLRAAGFDRLDAEQKPAALLAFLFDTLGVIPDTAPTGLGEDLPGQVLKTRRGDCVGLTLLTLALAKTMGVEARPVFLPSHVFVRLRSGAQAWRNAELLRRGLARSDSFYRTVFRLAQRPWYRLTSADPVQALAALLFNLANAHRAAGRTSLARREYARVLEVIPGFPDAAGAEGALWLRAGDADSALACLRLSLAGDSLSSPAWDTYARALERARQPGADLATARAQALHAALPH